MPTILAESHIDSDTIILKTPKLPTTTEFIRMMEIEYGLRKNILRNTLWCESRLDHSICENGGYCDNGKAYGIAQFHKGTFEDFKKESGMQELDYTSKTAQIRLAAWGFANSKASHWTCYRSLLSINK